uniref:Uncharacterized protein n=1 Tax=Arundo donax TaxID=35708 RepID=A0A0A9G366_ARUDO
MQLPYHSTPSESELLTCSFLRSQCTSHRGPRLPRLICFLNCSGSISDRHNHWVFYLEQRSAKITTRGTITMTIITCSVLGREVPK